MIFQTFSGFKLYLEDLENIYEILNQYNEQELVIIVNDYKLSNMSEITEENFKKINYLKIRTGDTYPKIELEYKNSSLYLIASEDSIHASGIVLQINKIIEESTFLIYKFINKFGSLILPILSITVIINFLSFIDILPFYDTISYSNIIFGVIVFFSYLIPYLFNKSTKGLIYNNYSSLEENFWERKKDDIILSLISAIIGSILIPWLVQYIFK